MIFRGGRVFAFASAGAAYLTLVAGGLLPLAADGVEKALAKAAMLIVFICLFALSKHRRSTIQPIAIFTAVGMVIGIALLTRTTNTAFAVDKIDGAIICAAAVALLLRQGYDVYGQQTFLSSFLWWSFAVLVATVAYKLQAGFFDRGVRFLLNGPIVYGWLMGFCSLLAYHIWHTKRKPVFGGLFFAFLLGLIWTESKGSLLAFLAGLLLYVALNARESLRRSLPVIAVFFAVLYFLFDAVQLFLQDSRLSAIARIFAGELSATDEGSVGMRSLLADIALDQFAAHPLFGIGLGNFRYGEYLYPHNQHLEMFAEGGVFVGSLHLLFIAIAFARADALHKSVLVLFFVASSFSGDASYLRFLYAFSLLALLPRPSIAAPVTHGRLAGK